MSCRAAASIAAGVALVSLAQAALLGCAGHAHDHGEEEHEHEHEHETEEAREDRALGSLDELATRLAILRHARDAQARAGHEESAELVERAIHVGELQLEGADAETVSAAAEGLIPGTLIELLQQSSELYRGWGQPDRADLCNELAELYARRVREAREHENEHEHEE